VPHALASEPLKLETLKLSKLDTCSYDLGISFDARCYPYHLPMICSHCASEMPEISAFCPGCGREVRGAAEYLTPANAQEALLGALAYLTVIPAILFLILPAFRDKQYVRFHSWQSILFAVAAAIIGLAMRLIFAILSFVPFVGFLFAWLSVGMIFLAIVVLWAVLVVKAGQGQAYQLPWLGHFAAQLSK
jgi:uncharacterized membrane protein